MSDLSTFKLALWIEKSIVIIYNKFERISTVNGKFKKKDFLKHDFKGVAAVF